MKCTKRYEPIMYGRKPVVVAKTTRWRQDMCRYCFGHAYSDCSLVWTYHDEEIDLACRSPDPVCQQQSGWCRFHTALPQPAPLITSGRTEYPGTAADRHWAAALAHAQFQQRHLRRPVASPHANGRARRPFCLFLPYSRTISAGKGGGASSRAAPYRKDTGIR